MEHDGKGLYCTFTYAPKYLPPGGNLNPRDMTLFFKRLRRWTKAKIRYYYCGEYGEECGRPHYHAAIWGLQEKHRHWIRKCWCKGTIKKKQPLPPSIGWVEISGIGPESAAYIAGYITKVISIRINKTPEFSRMSNRPGIGAWAIQKIAVDLIKSKMINSLPGGDAPGTLQFGDKTVPIGRYLKNVLRENLGIDQATRDAAAKARAINMLELYGKKNMRENYLAAVQGRMNSTLARKKLRKGRGRIHEAK